VSVQTWTEVLATQQAAGTLFNTYTTAKTVLNPQALYVLPAGFWSIGKSLEIIVHAGVSNRVTGPDTMTFQIMHGSTVVFTSGAVNLTTTAHTTIPAIITCTLTCRSVGSGTSATLMGQFYLEGQMFAQAASLADNAGGTGYALGPNTAPAVGGGFDSTVSNILDFWVAQSVSNAGNGIQVQQYMVKSLN
jgi:hypothetical protein